MSHPQKPDPCASEADTAELLVPDTRTTAESTLDTLLDDAGCGEQGADPVQVLRRVGAGAGGADGGAGAANACIYAEESWGPDAITMNASFLHVIRRTEAAYGITKGST
jgi:hypothetical protein